MSLGCVTVYHYDWADFSFLRKRPLIHRSRKTAHLQAQVKPASSGHNGDDDNGVCGGDD